VIWNPFGTTIALKSANFISLRHNADKNIFRFERLALYATKKGSDVAADSTIMKSLEDILWNAAYQRLVDYKEEFGHPMLQERTMMEVHLILVCGLRIRDHYTEKKTLKDDRMQKLGSIIGFAWSCTIARDRWQSCFVRLLN
jgi:hypothetical protein